MSSCLIFFASVPSSTIVFLAIYSEFRAVEHQTAALVLARKRMRSRQDLRLVGKVDFQKKRTVGIARLGGYFSFS